MSTDPNARICHHCGLSENPFSEHTWWHLRGYRDSSFLDGLACPSCFNKFKHMTASELGSYRTYLKVTEKLES